jgi:hypothetical protein
MFRRVMPFALALAACSESTNTDSGTLRDGGTPRDAAVQDALPEDPDAGFEDTGPRGDAGAIDIGPINADCDELLEATCRYLSRCQSYAPITEADQPAVCHPLLRRRLCGYRDRAIADGRLMLDDDARTQCTQALITAPCSATNRILGPAICQRVYLPLQQIGETCFDEGECIDSFCDRGVTCPGQCAPLRAVDEQCGSSAECTPDAFCSQRTDACAMRAGADMNCETGVTGTESCVEGYWCDGVLVQPGQERCVPTGNENEGCLNPNFEAATCTADLICMFGTCSTGPQENAACSSADPCGVNLHCSNLEGGQCVRAVGPGDTCSVDGQCPGGFTCQQGRCTALPIVGEECSDKRPCKLGACENGVCVALHAGDDCNFEEEQPCVDGYCSTGTSTCAPYVAEQQPCNDEVTCVPGAECINGTCLRCADF